jgi:hypothetical protein
MPLRFDAWARRYGSVYVYWMGPQPVLIVSDTEMTQKVLRINDAQSMRA